MKGDVRQLKSLPRGTINGFCDPMFDTVMDVFAENFLGRDELGASLAITHKGEIVADLWGGMANEKTNLPWERDTLTTVFSATKGACAIAVHWLVERGALDLNAPISRLWPEYAQNGKGTTTLAMLLDHTAGIPALRGQLPPGAMLDWNAMVERIASEEPFFEPGTRTAYHALTFAWTVGELVRRATGRSLGEIFRSEIAQPLGLDFHIGVSDAEEISVTARYAPIQMPRVKIGRAPGESHTLGHVPGSLSALAFLNHGSLNHNRPETRRAEIGSANGIGNARSLALLYRPIALGQGLLQPDSIARMARVSSATHFDPVLKTGTRFGLGFMRACDNRQNTFGGDSVIIGEHAFGHVGAGGAIGFADVEAEMSFGYVMNQQGLGVMLNARGQMLVDATYRALGYRSNESGAWRR